MDEEVGRALPQRVPVGVRPDHQRAGNGGAPTALEQDVTIDLPAALALALVGGYPSVMPPIPNTSATIRLYMDGRPFKHADDNTRVSWAASLVMMKVTRTGNTLQIQGNSPPQGTNF